MARIATESVERGHETISIRRRRRTESVGKDESITIGGGRTESVAKDENVDIGQHRTITIAKNETVNIGEVRAVQVGKDDTLKSARISFIDAGDSITIKTGDASISMKKNGTITIKGKNITHQRVRENQREGLVRRGDQGQQDRGKLS